MHVGGLSWIFHGLLSNTPKSVTVGRAQSDDSVRCLSLIYNLRQSAYVRPTPTQNGLALCLSTRYITCMQVHPAWNSPALTRPRSSREAQHGRHRKTTLSYGNNKGVSSMLTHTTTFYKRRSASPIHACCAPMEQSEQPCNTRCNHI